MIRYLYRAHHHEIPLRLRTGKGQERRKQVCISSLNFSHIQKFTNIENQRTEEAENAEKVG